MDFVDILNRKITLTSERWKHIIGSHPELKDLVKDIGKTLLEPELITKSVYDDNVLLIE